MPDAVHEDEESRAQAKPGPVNSSMTDNSGEGSLPGPVDQHPAACQQPGLVNQHPAVSEAPPTHQKVGVFFVYIDSYRYIVDNLGVRGTVITKINGNGRGTK
jgi:hypothetical protein